MLRGGGGLQELQGAFSKYVLALRGISCTFLQKQRDDWLDENKKAPGNL
jgi:hypothetical protein